MELLLSEEIIYFSLFNIFNNKLLGYIFIFFKFN